MSGLGSFEEVFFDGMAATRLTVFVQQVDIVESRPAHASPEWRVARRYADHDPHIPDSRTSARCVDPKPDGLLFLELEWYAA